MPRFRYDRPPSRASDAPRADAVQVRQAAQQREGFRQGRRAAGSEGVAPAAGRGAGCHSGRGRGSGERCCLRAAERRDGHSEAESIPSLPGTEPIRQAFRPPSAFPPHAARGPYLSSIHWSLERVARGQARLVGLLPRHSIAGTRVAIRCSSPSTRDGQTLKISRIGIFQNYKFR